MSAATHPSLLLPSETEPDAAPLHSHGGGAGLERQDDLGGREGSTLHVLRRTGRRAVRFEGWQLVEARGPADGRQVWHDLNIYRSLRNAIVVELIVRSSLPDHPDVCRVKCFSDLAAAAAWLEGLQPADGIPIPRCLSTVDTALPWAVLQAVQLRQRIDRIESDYQALVSDVFAALDLTDTTELRHPYDRPVPASAAA